MTNTRTPRHPRRSQGGRFRPAFERLEDRVVPVGQPFVEAPVIQSVNGVLTTTLIAKTGDTVVDVNDYTGFVANGGTVFANATTYQVQGAPLGLLQGPTLQVNPGDTLDITIVNGIEDVEGYTTFGPTNLHTHGLHVSQLGNSDNVFLEIEPAQNGQPAESNRYTIKIPADHPQGIYWYHPHRHEFVNSQIFGGLSGLLIIGRPDSGATQLNGLTQRVMGIKSFETAEGAFVDASDQNVANTSYAVNGQFNPTLGIAPGEAQVWNVGNISNDAFLSLVVRNTTTPADAPQIFLVAQDGNPLTRPVPVTSVDLAPGNRASFLVVMPLGTEGDTIELQTQTFVDGFNQWPLGPSGPTTVTLATAAVSNTPVTPFVVPTQLNPPANYFEDLRDDPVAESRTLVFDQGPGLNGGIIFTVDGQQFPNVPLIQPRLGTVEEWTLINLTDDIHPFHIHQNDFQIISINGVPLDPNGPPVTANVAYPSGKPPQQQVFVGGNSEDVVDIPAASPHFPFTPGTIVIRMKFEGFIGPYVYHCHRVGHEDLGMMGVVNVVPNDPTYAIGQNPGSPSRVRVFSSVTNQQVAGFLAFPGGTTAGVNVAYGDVNGDGVYDIVAGSKGSTRVRVIDGTMLDDVNAGGVIRPSALLADFFAFAKGQTGGVSVSTGDVNGDGLADVIFGRGTGRSRVQVADATKLTDVNADMVLLPDALLANFLAFSPNFQGGVTVASGDVDGNGRIDVVVGSGPGGRARVAVIDGEQLDDVNPDGQINPDALFGMLLPFGDNFTQGVTVGTGNLKGYGFDDVIIGAAAGQPPKMAVYTPETILEDPLMFEVFDEFFVYRPDDLSGVVVSSFWDPDNDILLVTPGTGQANLPSTYNLGGRTPTGGGHGGGGGHG